MCGRERRGAVTLPLYLHEEILYRLRSDDLRLNFKLVCKDWERLISSPEFIQKHLERSKDECHEPRILVPSGYDAEILDCADIESSKTIPRSLDAFLLGSCDGLVLYHDTYEKKTGALNLSTGKSEVRTPNPSMEDDMVFKVLICSWFGRHPSSGEYVLVLANLYRSEAKTNKPKRVVFNVHALSRNDTDSLLSSSTRELDWDDCQHIGNLSGKYYDARWVDSNEFNHVIGTLCQGRVHCPISLNSTINGGVEILAYDFEANDIIRMDTPLKHCQALGVADGYLCAVDKRAVWVMKEYGVEECWTKYADIDFGHIRIHTNFCPNGDVIIIDFYDYVGMFDIRGRESGLLKALRWVRKESVACTDSLVSPAMVWTQKK